ncbi:MAG: ComEA family DNA-binding protein [Thermoanaerobacteraceae bacterium]|uniref:ComEA family DNA-binding protein n=1 Tax=Thermanaeromonas sp. C210 TaxID=2731925 RepID=UPI00155CD41A|nr:ComEA family DNA-binding protein [Thermanaeromonas sp. C210]MBE3580093.1 ComEA family DNA-binding protein [Thermoanaerobacteraceae bacterium]GFN22561.1 competence protein ComEA [Thermanaeromonas sp. C210]
MWEWDSRVRWVGLLLAVALVFGAGVQYGRWRQSKEAVVPAVEKEAISAAPLQGEALPGEEKEDRGNITVHVAGAVERPGVYQLPAGARVNEAVQVAGPLPEANPHALNLAAPLQDGQQVVVPRQGEEGSAPASPGAAAGGVSRGKININTASLEELDSLPGIGPALAQRILDYRQQHGPFRTIEDLQNVSGIGVKRFEELKELITVY